MVMYRVIHELHSGGDTASHIGPHFKHLYLFILMFFLPAVVVLKLSTIFDYLDIMYYGQLSKYLYQYSIDISNVDMFPISGCGVSLSHSSLHDSICSCWVTDDSRGARQESRGVSDLGQTAQYILEIPEIARGQEKTMKKWWQNTL